MTALLTGPSPGDLAPWLDEEVADDRDLTSAELGLGLDAPRTLERSP